MNTKRLTLSLLAHAYTWTWRMLKPMRRWLRPGSWGERVLRRVEHLTKGPLFHCRMCGDCVLHSTGMVCPMNCPKNIRNGPCGGVRDNGMCEVYPDRVCVWVRAHERARHLPRYGHEITHILPPHDWSLEGTSAWANALHGRSPLTLPHWGTPTRDRPVGSRLEQVLREGTFAVTVELNPPDSANPEDVYKTARVLAPVCHAMNVVDASGANVHMSSLAVCALLVRAGYEPVYQISARDRNRIAIQGDLLGAAALGIRNVLFITGDHVSRGDHPHAKPVFDLDSIQMLHTARIMRDHGHFLSGRELSTPPSLFLGAVANPFVPPYEDRVERLEKKVRAGAQFVQTQYCFDVDRLRAFMQRVRDRGLDRKVHILVGVGPLRSARAAEYMRSHIPGIVIPDAIIRRLRSVPRKKQQEEGVRIAVELIQQIREIDGIAGVHIMAFRQEEWVPYIVEEAGL